MKIKKVPMRKCLGCMEMKEKKSLVRVVKNKENEIDVDLGGKMNGRGAYVCRSSECLDKAIKARRFERAFETSIQEDVYQKLREQMEEANGR